MSRIEKLKAKARLLQKAKKKAGIPFKLKDALDAVARPLGFASWRDLMERSRNYDLYTQRSSAFLNHWLKTYEEAQLILRREGGFLLPFGNQFFLCQAEYLECLGVQKDDPDLILAGNDWICPENRDALHRLNEKIRRTKEQMKK